MDKQPKTSPLKTPATSTLQLQKRPYHLSQSLCPPGYREVKRVRLGMRHHRPGWLWQMVGGGRLPGTREGVHFHTFGHKLISAVVKCSHKHMYSGTILGTLGCQEHSAWVSFPPQLFLYITLKHHCNHRLLTQALGFGASQASVGKHTMWPLCWAPQISCHVFQHRPFSSLPALCVCVRGVKRLLNLKSDALLWGFQHPQFSCLLQ